MHEFKRHLQPLAISHTRRHHRPIAAPHDSICAKALKYVCHELVELGDTDPNVSLRQQPRQFAIGGGATSELINLTRPRVEGCSGNIGFAGMIKYCPELWMSPQAALEHRQVTRRHERIERKIVFQDCAEGRVKRGAFHPPGITDVLDHRTQTLELSLALLHKAANSIRHVACSKIY